MFVYVSKQIFFEKNTEGHVLGIGNGFDSIRKYTKKRVGAVVQREILERFSKTQDTQIYTKKKREVCCSLVQGQTEAEVWIA